jgi:hypothetical protein
MSLGSDGRFCNAVHSCEKTCPTEGRGETGGKGRLGGSGYGYSAKRRRRREQSSRPCEMF